MELIFKQAALLGDTWVLWLLLGCSVLVAAVAIEKWRELAKEAQQADKLEAGQEAEAGSSAARILDQVASVKSAAAMEEMLKAALLSEGQRLKNRIGILGTLGNNAPFIGLFGTVLGVIKAFHDLGVSGQTGVAVVMEGIATALVITALGIFVAIPAVIFNNIFLSRADQVLEAAEAAARKRMAARLDEGK